MARSQQDLIKETEKLSKGVTKDAEFTILTIRNLIESNSMVEGSIDELHKSINNSNIQNEKLQRKLFYLTVVGIILASVQVLAVILQFLK